MSSDITAFRVAASGQATAQPVRVQGVFFAATAVGSIELRNGTVGGQLLAMFDASGAGMPNILLPGNGIKFPAGVFVVITGGISGVTLFCG